MSCILVSTVSKMGIVQNEKTTVAKNTTIQTKNNNHTLQHKTSL